MRDGVVTAIARTAPSRICGIISGSVSNMAWMLPCLIAGRLSFVPR
jgi:hypothetical protein